jgi:flagellar biosynthesis/type III secretory pathway protein FliH
MIRQPSPDDPALSAATDILGLPAEAGPQDIVLAISDERSQQERVGLIRETEAYGRGYRVGHQDGYQAGREDQAAEAEADWHWMARRIAKGDPRSFDELEQRRQGDAA